MTDISTLSTPSYLRQKQTGRHDRAFVEIDGQRHYLGRYGSDESHRQYDRLIGEWLAGGRRLAAKPERITVAEVTAAFLKHADTYYDPAGDEKANFVLALRPLSRLYGRDAAGDFGPRKLKAVRHAMVEAGGSRFYVNRRVDRIKHVFKWAKNEELIPPSIYESIRDLPGLRRGRTTAHENQPIQPVPEAYVDAVLDVLPPTVAAMVRLQRLTGMRPGELCIMRTADIDTTGSIWTYTPAEHKTAHHGRSRTVWIGPRAQAVLTPWLKPSLEAFLFSPAEAEAQRRQQQHTARKTPLSCGNKPGSNRKAKPAKSAGEQYTPDSYRRAIHNACDKANVPRWSPNRLRHNYATLIRREHGLEAAQVLLGHAKADVTQVYAERDAAKALEVAMKVG